MAINSDYLRNIDYFLLEGLRIFRNPIINIILKKVIRFYQNICPLFLPPPFPPFPPPRLVIFLAILLVSASSASTSALPTSPSSLPISQLSAHCWTSTYELPNSVRIAGPQPTSCPTQ